LHEQVSWEERHDPNSGTVPDLHSWQIWFEAALFQEFGGDVLALCFALQTPKRYERVLVFT